MARLPLVLSLVVIAALTMIPVLAYKGETTANAARSLVIVTPHNEQIRYEFGRGFSRWHRDKYGESVAVDWSTPGGTSEIRRMLVAQYEADLRHGTPVGGDADIIFGGGSYEFQALARTLVVAVEGQERSTRILDECPWMSDAQLDELFGDNAIDGQPLYDKDRRWFGAALSTFGIVADEALCARLGVDPPETWESLADPRLFGFVALVNPAQSGSVATAFETILQRLGWTRGWQVLRRAAANSNQILAASSRVPTTVGNGESAAGIAIDFYGRYQVQSLADEAEIALDPTVARLSFVTPKGQSVVDADPVAILRGAPNPETAQRFVEYCLSDAGQLLWQLAAGTGDACGAPRPEHFTLRRLPARRHIYECCASCFVDRVDPFAEQAPMNSNPHFRDFVSPLFVSMALNQAPELRAAWRRIFTHPAYPHGGGIVSAADVTDPELARWLEAFDALPTLPGADGAVIDLSEIAELPTARAGWIRRGFTDQGLWSDRENPLTLMRRRCTEFFGSKYRSIIER